VGGVAIVLLVLLRMSIGWQFLYEGMWKLDTFDSPRPWTSAGYLRNAQGPFRDKFREMTGDPDELNWLNSSAVAARWDAWHQKFLAHYPDLDDRQAQSLDEMLNGRSEYVAELKKLPDGIVFDFENELKSLKGIVQFDEKRERLIVDGKKHLLPAERDKLLGLVDHIGESSDAAANDESLQKDLQAYRKAVNDVYKRASNLSFKERLAASLNGDPERAGLYFEKYKGTIDEEYIGKIKLYENLLQRYEKNHRKAEQDFQHEHLSQQWDEIQNLRAELVGPVKALEAEFKSEANKLLRPEQLAAGPVGDIPTKVSRMDHLTIWSLVILGCLLIAGLFSRLAALGGAGMLLMFYLAIPPWPGVPEISEVPGPEHAYIVNKNSIEIVALLAIACLPTGQWFGTDGLLRWVFRRRQSGSSGGNGFGNQPVAQPATGSSSPEKRTPVTAQNG
jgi:uncharacterized membrane protein YphA (DoxX/SURF4 family)